MTTWILFVMIGASPAHGSITSTAIEGWRTKALCEAAGAAIEAGPKPYAWAKVTFTCLEQQK